MKDVPGTLADATYATVARGYEIVRDAESLPASSNTFLSVECPPGKQVVGGGVSAIDESTETHNRFVRVIESYPNSGFGFSGWAAFLSNDQSSAADAQVYAICVDH